MADTDRVPEEMVEALREAMPHLTGEYSDWVAQELLQVTLAADPLRAEAEVVKEGLREYAEMLRTEEGWTAMPRGLDALADRLEAALGRTNG